MNEQDRPETDPAEFDPPTLPPRGSAFDETTLPPDASSQDKTIPPTEASTSRAATVGDRVRYFGDYELLEEIARGGMGVVFKARQINLNRIVALKMILAGQFAGQEDVQRFYTEAEAAAQLDHPGIVPIFEIGEQDGQHYFSMGYIEGESLAQRIADRPLPPREAAELMQKVCDAISYAHDRNVIHRDLKPANILLDPSGQPKVTDFGLAKKTEADSGLTGTGQILGTPAYMPPEQAAGQVDGVGRPADVYSLGAVLYCLLTGQPPFQAASPMDTLLQVLEKEPTAPRQINATVPVDLETICLKCLEKEASRRYESAAALSADLGRYLADEPIEARPSSAAYKLWRKAKRNRTTSLALAAAFVAVIGGTIFFLQSRHTASRERAAQESAKGAHQALQRVQESQGIQQLAIVPFENLSGNPEEDWLGAGFASVLQTKLSGNDALKVVGKGPMEAAASALAIVDGEPMDEALALKFGKQLVVNYVITGEFQRVAEQIQVSARLLNIQTGAVERGGMQVQGEFAGVFDLQTDLANQCLVQLGVAEPTASETAGNQDTGAIAAAPAASVEAWTFLGRGQQSLSNGDFDQAIRLCTRAIEEDPNLAMAFRTKAIAHLKINEVEESLQAFQRATEINPQDWASQAYFNLLSGRVVEGLAALNKAEEAGEADLDLLKLSTNIEMEVTEATGGKHSTDQLKAAIEKYPEDEELHVILATAQSKNGDADAAIETLQQAITVNPKDFAAHLLLSLAYEDRGDKDQADRELAEAEKYRPDGIRGFRDFADTYADAGKTQRAIEELNKAFKLDPDDSASHVELGELYVRSDIFKAIGHFESALVQRPKSLQILSGLCRLCNLVGQDGKLQQYASRWVEADPDSYEARQYLRVAYLKAGQMAKADAELETITQLTPRHKTFFVMTGNTLIQTSFSAAGMIDEAIRVLQTGTQAYPADTLLPGMLKYAQALKPWHLRRWQPATQIFEELEQELQGEDLMSQALRRDCAAFLATCYEQLDRIPEAAEQIRKAAQIMPEAVSAQKAFSIFEQAAKYDYAIELAKTHITSRPNDLRLHRDLIRYHALAGQWDEAKTFFAGLPSVTEDDFKRRIHVGVTLADWMAKRGQITEAAAQNSIATLISKSTAAVADDVPEETLTAYSRWAKFPQRVLVIGPFAGGSEIDGLLQPETTFDPDARYPGDTSRLGPRPDLYWQVIEGRAGDRFELPSLDHGRKNLIAYYATHLISPQQQAVTLKVNVTTPGKFWLNGQELKLFPAPGGGAMSFAALNQGANLLLAKSTYYPDAPPLAVVGQWYTSLEAVDVKGLPVPIRWSTDPDLLKGDARARVHALEKKRLIKQDIIDHLEQDESLQGDERTFALAIANQLPADVDRIGIRRLLDEVADGADAGRTAIALRAATTICRDNPTDRRGFGCLARVCYVTGKFETAIKAATRAIELDRKQIGTPDPEHLAVLAMSHHQLGQPAEASAALVRLRDLMIGLAGFRAGEQALRETSSVLGDSIPQLDGLDAIKQMIFQADRAGWKEHRFDDFARVHADDFEMTVGRGPNLGEYDIVVDRETFHAVKKLKYQEPAPGDGHFVAYQAIEGSIEGDQARLIAEVTLGEPNGFVIYGREYQLRLEQDRWQLQATRQWPILKRWGEELTTYDAKTWSELDADVKRFMEQGKRRETAERLRRAYRFKEMMEMMKQITESPDANANDWRIRGSMAFNALKPDEILACYRKAIELNPNIYVPDYQELVQAAPAGFVLESADMPASREGTIRSMAGGPASQMIFKNQTNYTLLVYWLNNQGERQGPWSRIRPGATWDYQGSRRNHPWLVTDSEGRGLGIFVADKPSRTIELKPAE